jgi:hypothetical protein
MELERLERKTHVKRPRVPPVRSNARARIGAVTTVTFKNSGNG